MKTSQLICMLFIATALISCRSEDIDLQKYATFGISELSLPDSILTKEQKQTKKKLAEVIVTNLGVKDDKVTFMERNEFLKKGLAESFYDQIKEGVNELNSVLSRDTTSRRQFLEDLPVALARIKEKVQKYPDSE